MLNTDMMDTEIFMQPGMPEPRAKVCKEISIERRFRGAQAVH